MNVRQQKYKEFRLKGFSAYKSAINAGYTHATAINAHRNVEKRCNFDDLMRAHGLDDDTLLQVVRDGVFATKNVSSMKLGGEEGLAAVNVVEPDWGNRHKFVETSLKLKGLLKERHEHTGKDGIPLPAPIINIYGSKADRTDRIGCLHTQESA